MQDDARPTIFLLLGETGEYSDYHAWSVVASHDRAAVDAYSDELNAIASEGGRWPDGYQFTWEKRELLVDRLRAAGDASAAMDYTSTHYYVEEVPLLGDALPAQTGKPRRVLVSPGYGAGWATWADQEAGRFAAEYLPIIEFLEAGGSFVEKRGVRDHEEPWMAFEEPGASVLKQFLDDLFKETGEDHFFLGGAEDLTVRTVNGPYRIDEYDGAESLVEAAQEVWW